jgi:hypothetical protein
MVEANIITSVVTETFVGGRELDFTLKHTQGIRGISDRDDAVLYGISS